MVKKSLNPNDVISKNLTAIAQQLTPKDKINKIALRRSKVRELTQMGYHPVQIFNILEKGIKIGDNETVKIAISQEIVERDIEYLQQEELSKDVDFAEKRAEIKDKLDFLYQRAVTEYINAKGATRATFMNTALSILAKIMEMEGVKSPENLNINLGAEAKIAKFATEVHKLNKNDRDAIIGTIRKVVEQRKLKRIGNV
jgi:hypothetical protein